jgi:hypothetical protein
MRKLMISVIVLLLVVSTGGHTNQNQDIFSDLPAGLTLQSTVEVDPERTKAIGQKLGGRVSRLTNSVLRVHGRTIQINIITAADESDAEIIHSSLSRIKSYPFCFMKGRLVIEYVGRNVDIALAKKASYELGLLDKPTSVRYQIDMELAAVDSVDYMHSNPMFNHLISFANNPDQEVKESIAELSKQFAFGSAITLANPALYDEATEYSFQPGFTRIGKHKSCNKYYFEELPKREGVPYVTVSIDILVDSSDLRISSESPSSSLIEATDFWPADDPRIVDLAKKITEDCSGNGEKAAAILEWLTPGKHIKYAGETGSRWGTARVIDQAFGHCWDFSDCFVTLTRAVGVPSRQIAGWFYGSSGHVWAEYYLEEKGWHQVDPTGGGKLQCGIYHIPYFVSDDGAMPFLYLSVPVIEEMPEN